MPINMKSKKADEQIAAAIEVAQGKARERIITPEIVREELEAATRYLNISKKAMEGTIVYINHHDQKFPKAYKYKPEATVFAASFEKRAWRVLWVMRLDCRNFHHREFVLSEAAQEAILKKVCNGMAWEV